MELYPEGDIVCEIEESESTTAKLIRIKHKISPTLKNTRDVPPVMPCDAPCTVQLTGNVARRHSRLPQWNLPRGPNADMPRTRPESNCVDNHQPREYFYSSARTSQRSTCTQACRAQQPAPHCS